MGYKIEGGIIKMNLESKSLKRAYFKGIIDGYIIILKNTVML